MGCGTYSTTRPEEVQISAFLTPRQVDLVKHSWDLVKDDMEATGLLIYARQAVMGCGTYSTTRPEEVQISAFLTPRQVDLVKHSWDLVKDDMEATGLLIYARFIDTEKDLRRYFPKILENHSGQLEKWEVNELMLKNHASIVMEGLGAAVESLEDSTCLHAILLSVGEKHYDMKIKPQFLERLWPSIDFGLKEVLQDVYTRDVKESWKQIFLYIITKMREGMARARYLDKEMSKSHGEEYSHISNR